MKHPNRRHFLQTTVAAGLAQVLSPPAAWAADPPAPRIATNTYPWETFARRDGTTFPLHTPESLAAIASTGITGYEPNIRSVADFPGLAARLREHGLEMRSIYVNSSLHDEATSAESIAGVLAIARLAVGLGTRIVVTNPSPIQWGGTENKSDAQLRHQAAALDQLGVLLAREGVTLAYHNHDAELRLGGREFHHMLTATDPDHVKLCLDAHWIFRGCGDSPVALFDAISHYGSRIVELHLRQSERSVWSETFAATGDIDYTRLTAWLKEREMQPLLVLEQAVEEGSPRTMDAVAAHRQSLIRAMELFRGFA